MIPRYQRILFWALLVVAAALAVVLIRLRERAADRITGVSLAVDSVGGADSLEAPLPSAEEDVTLLEADDLSGALVPISHQLALPREPGARAKVLLRELLADYAAPGSKHPLTAGPGGEEVFFMAGATTDGGTPGSRTAIVNLTAAFAENHTSGIEAEMLTLESIIGTMRENFPAVGRVRFLVDGRPRETLAGHADLLRVYSTVSGDIAR